MSIDSDRWTIAVRKYGQCAPWSFFATMEHADMDLTGLEGTLMCSMVGQNDHGARIETFPGPHLPALSDPTRDAKNSG